MFIFLRAHIGVIILLWTDASLKLGLAFVDAGNGYQICPPSVKINIFFLELVAILSAVVEVW